MSIHGFCELTLEARDMANLESFYTEMFDLEVISREDDRIWLAAGEHARVLHLPLGGGELLRQDGLRRLGVHARGEHTVDDGELHNLAEAVLQDGRGDRPASTLPASPAGAHQWQPVNGGGANTVPDPEDGSLSRPPTMLTSDLALRFDPIYEPTRGGSWRTPISSRMLSPGPGSS